MPVIRRALIALSLVVALGLAACADEDPAPTTIPTSTATPEATATASTSPTPEADPTGIAEVDEVIAMVAAKDIPGLVDRVAWIETECRTVEGLGGPPRCEDGEAEGTVVRVLPAAACEGYFVREADTLIGSFVQQAQRLHSVVEAPTYERQEPYWPVGDYYINYVADVFGEQVGHRLVIEDGQIALLFFGCNHPPALLLQDGGQDLPVVYLAPEQ